MKPIMFNSNKKLLQKVPQQRDWKIRRITIVFGGMSVILFTVALLTSKETRSAIFVIDRPFGVEARTRVKQLIGTRSSNPFEISGRNSPCLTMDCNEVTCSSISTPNDPGKIASEYIAEIFEIQCGKMESIRSLVFQNCDFPDGKLSQNWLKSNTPISSIIFRNNSLSSFDENSFPSNVFSNTRSLSIVYSSIPKIHKFVFDQLPNLRSLTIQNNLIEEAEYNLLGSVANTLETLVLDTSIKNFQVLLNFTAGNTLPEVQLLSLQGNRLELLPSNSFRGIPNIKSLYMQNSSIEDIEKNPFEPLEAIQQIFLSNNFISTIPQNMFTSLLLRNPNLKVTMTGNPWKCDCSFSWMKDLIKSHPNFMTTIPECKSPEENAGLSFSQATFCRATNSTESDIRITTPETSEVENQQRTSLKISCNDLAENKLINFNQKILPSSDFELLSKVGNFSVQQLKNGSIFINLTKLLSNIILIWFKNDAKSIPNFHCLKNLKGPILLDEFEANSLYTFCVLENHFIPTPFNCLALSTKPQKSSQTWLINSDKPVMFTLIASFMIFFFIIGGVFGFFLVRKYPGLLKGSPKVVMVKKGGIDAMVLPRGVQYDEKKNRVRMKRYENSEYLTPLGKRREFADGFDGYETIKIRDSRMSESVSSIVMSLKGDGENAPPLPPPRSIYARHGKLLTLSSIVDANIK